MSNLKQIGLSLMMYAQDWDSRLPSPLNGSQQWSARLAALGYVKNPGILVCPSWPPRKFMSWGATYGMNYSWPDNWFILHWRIDRPGGTPYSDRAGSTRG